MDVGELLAQEGSALGIGHRMGCDRVEVVERGTGSGHQIHGDVEHDLSLDQEVRVEGQGVERDVDGSFDGVLDGDEASVHDPVLGVIEDVDERSHRNQLGVLDQVVLGEERLLAVGPMWAEETDSAW